MRRAVALSLLVLAGACSAGGTTRTMRAQPVTPKALPADAFARTSAGSGTAQGAVGASPADAAPGVPPLPDRIVRNADVTLQVSKGSFDDKWSRVLATAPRFGGYLASANRAKPASGDDPPSGDITLRIPASRFETALVALRSLGKVTGEQSSSEDVTQQFIDLDARIRNLQAQEAVLLKLMERARSIGDTLAVQSPLSRTQEQIEELIGRRNALRTLTDYSTINVHLAEPGAAPAPKPAHGVAKVWHTAVVGLGRMGAVGLVGLIWLAPFAALGAGAMYVRRRLRGAPVAQS